MQVFFRELIKVKNIFLIVLLISLLTIPLYSHVYHMSLYYIIVVLFFMPLVFYRITKSKYLENKFYYTWGKKRKKGRLVNILSAGLQTIFLIVVVVFGSQFIVNGRTPSFILSDLPIYVSKGLMLFVLILGAICGIIAWYENEKRFNKFL